jgi:hypothetical protein
VLDGIARALSLVGPVDVSADTPLFRSFVDDGPLLQGLLGCPVPGRRELAVIPIDSGVSAPPRVTIGIPYAVVPAFHGGLLGDHTSAALIRDAIGGHVRTGSGVWRAAGGLVAAVAAAWQTPGLPRGVEPAWRHLPDPAACAAVRAATRRWLGSSGG